MKFLLSALLALLLCNAVRADNLISDVPFTKIAQLRTLKLKSKNLNIKVQYPVFRANTPVARYANWKMRLYAEKAYCDFLATVRKDFGNSAPHVNQEL